MALWIGLATLADRAWPLTLVAFGPRWVAALPLLLLLPAVCLPPVRPTLLLLSVVTGLVLLLGIMDFRLGLRRGSESRRLRVMTHNLGNSEMTAAQLNQLMREEQVDIAALQECPFYDYSPERFGWHFYYAGDLCLASKYAFSVMDLPDPERAWTHSGITFIRFELQTPAGPVGLMNVHLPTIRGALESFAIDHLQANRQEALAASKAARRQRMQEPASVIVAGDFNLPVESAIYRTFWGDLENAFSRCGRGFGYTKRADLFDIRIDHVLTAGPWHCSDARVVTSPYAGDHSPLIVDLFSSYTPAR